MQEVQTTPNIQSVLNFLRHNYASPLIEQGQNVKYIQSQLGHSIPTVTLNVHANLMIKINQGVAIKQCSHLMERAMGIVEHKVG